jgi:lipoate-protein ligase B
VRRLEDVLIGTLARFGLEAERDPGNTGVWVGAAKIGAIGVRVTRSVTKHGFALNVAPDLTFFAGIVPCGITDRGVTSMLAELGDAAPSLDAVTDVVAERFVDVFGYGETT